MTRLPHAALFALLACLALGPAGAAGAAGPGDAAPMRGSVAPAEPDPGLAARLFGRDGEARLERASEPVPLWIAREGAETLGFIASTWEIARSVGYSGRPIDILVAVTPEARIAGARLIRHSEPVLTLGISDADIAAYVNGFAGLDLTKPRLTAFDARGDLPEVISRATVSTGVIRDSILRTARTVAMARGLIGGAGRRIDRVSFAERSWDGLAAEEALAHARISLDEARAALEGARVAVPAGEGAFLELWAALIDPPTIGRNLLGQSTYTRVMGSLGPGDAAILVASRGVHSHRGLGWRQSGVFERIEVIQGEETIALTEADFLPVDSLAAAGAPEVKEISVFRLPGKRFDPAAPFRVAVTATRPAEGGGTVTMRMPVQYRLPPEFLTPPEALPEAEPLWRSAWREKRVSVAGVAAMLVVLTATLFFQESIVRRRRLWYWGRIAFLAVTFVWLGMVAGGQLSVVQVVAFLQSLLTGFRWETFLIEPVIFMLWGFVALGLLFWGRGVYCGWLCPFGALQELLSEIAQRLRIPQIAVPFVVQERLWVIKYTAFVAILALSFYSMKMALVAAEIEPFKTAISLRFLREWPFVAFAVGVLAAGLFIERFYCRYLCPLGAALAIPAKLKLFDWLHRRPQCGRECRLCEQHCTVGAIDPIGRINPNECVLCLRCQVIYHDDKTCPVLKRRARGGPA